MRGRRMVFKACDYRALTRGNTTDSHPLKPHRTVCSQSTHQTTHWKLPEGPKAEQEDLPAAHQASPPEEGALLMANYRQ